MKTLKKLSLLFLFLEFTACKSSNGEIEGSSPLRPAVFNVAMQSSTTWPGLCHRVQVDVATQANTPTTAGRERTVNLSTDLGGLYSDVDCLTPLTTYIVNASDQTFAFYFRSAVTGTASITATDGSLTQGVGSLSVSTASAEITLGQVAMNFNTLNFPSLSAQSLNSPYNSIVAGGKLFVSDASNNRILIWNTLPTSNQQAADLVLGQPNMTTNTCNTGALSAQTLCNPVFVHSDGTRLVVADEANSRVLIWNTLPTTTQQAADLVLGQPNMTSNADGTLFPSAINLAFPGAAFISGSKLLVTDSGSNRVLIWNTFPTANEEAADVVVGQPNFTVNASDTTAATLTYPYIVSVHGDQMFIADYGNSRILIWNSIPTSPGAAANLVIGQPDFTTFGSNTGGRSATSLSEAAAPVVDEQGRFYVPDFSNNRILIYNQIPTTIHQAADAVIGQVDFATATQNAGGVSATSIYNPWGLSISDGKLWVTEYGNHRVLRFTIPY